MKWAKIIAVVFAVVSFCFIAPFLESEKQEDEIGTLSHQIKDDALLVRTLQLQVNAALLNKSAASPEEQPSGLDDTATMQISLLQGQLSDLRSQISSLQNLDNSLQAKLNSQSPPASTTIASGGVGSQSQSGVDDTQVTVAPGGGAIVKPSGGTNTLTINNFEKTTKERFLLWCDTIEAGLSKKVVDGIAENPQITDFPMSRELSIDRYNALLEIIGADKSGFLTCEIDPHTPGGITLGGISQIKFVIIHINRSLFDEAQTQK